MSRISPPIHETQRLTCKQAVNLVILYHDGVASYSPCFPKENHGIDRVMKYIDKHDSVKAGISVRYRLAVVLLCRNMSARSYHYIDSLDCEIRTGLRN